MVKYCYWNGFVWNLTWLIFIVLMMKWVKSGFLKHLWRVKSDQRSQRAVSGSRFWKNRFWFIKYFKLCFCGRFDIKWDYQLLITKKLEPCWDIHFYKKNQILLIIIKADSFNKWAIWALSGPFRLSSETRKLFVTTFYFSARFDTF